MAVDLHSVEERLIRSVRFFRLEAAVYTTPSLSVETPDTAVRISWPFYTERVGTASNRNRCRTERRFFLRFLLSFSVSFCWTGLIGVCVGGPSKAEFVFPLASKDSRWARPKLALASVAKPCENLSAARCARERTCMRVRGLRTGALFPFLGEQRMWRDSAVCGLTATKGPAVAR